MEKFTSVNCKYVKFMFEMSDDFLPEFKMIWMGNFLAFLVLWDGNIRFVSRKTKCPYIARKESGQMFFVKDFPAGNYRPPGDLKTR